MPQTEAKKRIEELQFLLKHRPRSAKLLAELAQLTFDMDLARQSVELAPHQPFGYAALSVLCTDPFETRLDYLQQAIAQTHKRPQHGLARFGLLTRLLTEPPSPGSQTNQVFKGTRSTT